MPSQPDEASPGAATDDYRQVLAQALDVAKATATASGDGAGMVRVRRNGKQALWLIERAAACLEEMEGEQDDRRHDELRFEVIMCISLARQLARYTLETVRPDYGTPRNSLRPAEVDLPSSQWRRRPRTSRGPPADKGSEAGESEPPGHSGGSKHRRGAPA